MGRRDSCNPVLKFYRSKRKDEKAEVNDNASSSASLFETRESTIRKELYQSKCLLTMPTHSVELYNRSQLNTQFRNLRCQTQNYQRVNETSLMSWDISARVECLKRSRKE